MLHIWLINSAAAFAGWFAWNALLLSLDKDENEKSWTLKTYSGEHWDNWFASAAMIPVLLFLGYKGFELGQFNLDTGFDFGDVYYVASGFITEAVKVAYKKWIKKNA